MAIWILLHIVAMRKRLERNMNISITGVGELKELLPSEWHRFLSWIDKARQKVGPELGLRQFYIALSTLEATDLNEYLHDRGWAVNLVVGPSDAEDELFRAIR